MAKRTAKCDDKTSSKKGSATAGAGQAKGKGKMAPPFTKGSGKKK